MVEWVKKGLAVVTVILVFAAAFIVRCEPVENYAFTTVTVYSSSFVVMIGFALFSYRHKVNMLIPLGLLLISLVLKYFALQPDTLVTLVVSNIALGAIYGLSIMLL